MESFDILVQSTWKSSDQFQWSWWLWCCCCSDATKVTVYISADVISVHVMRMTKMLPPRPRMMMMMRMIKMVPPLVMMRPSPVPSVYTRARSTVYLNFRICALVTRSVLPKDEYWDYDREKNKFWLWQQSLKSEPKNCFVNPGSANPFHICVLTILPLSYNVNF